MASALEDFLAAVRAGRAAPSGPMKAGGGGAMASAGAPAPAPGNALLAAIQSPVASGTRGTNLTAANRRAKNPRGLYRRSARANFARERNLADADWRTWDPATRAAAQEMGILPGADKFDAGFREEFGLPDGDGPSIGSQLANIRWHGNPDGAVMDVDEGGDDSQNEILAAIRRTNALRRRPQTFATRG